MLNRLVLAQLVRMLEVQLVKRLLILAVCLGSVGQMPNAVQAQPISSPESSKPSDFSELEPITESNLEAFRSLTTQILELRQQRRYAEAIPLMKDVLAITEAVRGEHHPDVVTVLASLATLYSEQGDYSEIPAIRTRILSIQESILEPNHLEIAVSLNDLAVAYQSLGDYEAALPLYERSLSIRQAALEPNHPDIAISLNNIAVLYSDQGNYAAALPLQERALSISETAFGQNHIETATSLNNLAELYQAQGNYAAALPLYERTLSISETAFGKDHLNVATSLTNLARLYQNQNRNTDALPMYERALSIYERALGDRHPNVAIGLNNLAELFRSQGNYTAALPLYERALFIFQTTLGNNHPNATATLNNLALLHSSQGNYTAALSLAEQALSAYEATFVENHPSIANSLNNLAVLYQNQENYTAALPLLERALLIREIALGRSHPDTANSLSNLANLHMENGNYAESLRLYEQALSIFKTTLGPDHPDVATTLNNLSVLYWAQDDIDHATELSIAGAQIEESNLSDILLGASESRRQQYIKMLKGTTDANISLSIQNASIQSESSSLAATHLALSNILQRKGRVLDSTASTLQHLRKRLTHTQQLQLDQLSAVRSTIANLRFNGPGSRTLQNYQAELTQLENKAEAIEEQLSRSSAEFRAKTTPVSVSAVKEQISDDAALVEFVRYTSYDPRTTSNASRVDHYAVYVLTQRGEATAVDLGPAASVDQLVAQFQAVLSTQSASANVIARQLYQKLMAPLRPHLSGKTHLLLSPDSQLNLIPFDALVDENNRYLIETYQISYLSSGRDLLKYQHNKPSQQPPVIIANPNYAEGMPIVIAESNSSKSVDADSLTFAPLPGTAQEAVAIAPFLPNAIILTENEASESNLKQVNAPSILHIATHGFFLPDVEFIPPTDSNSRNGLGASFDLVNTEESAQVTPSNLENPLLRSGLALAGANVRSSGTEDGIFTALEASSLNLNGTQLVVLSACETGVGSISNGEGVYGLRRTFAIAGAESQMMSLWQVDDTGTSELMQLYYQNLIEKKQGRSEALRNAQLELLNTGTYQHPYYWSSFIFSGDWRPLE